MTALSAATPYHRPAGASGHALFDMSHLDNPWRPAHVPLILVLLLSGMVAGLLYLAIYGDTFSESALWVYCWLYAGVTVAWALAKTLRPRPHNWLSPDVVFWLVYTMFHIPFVVFYLVGLADYSRTVFFAADATNRAMCCVVLSGIGFLLGYELGPVGRRQPARFAPATRVPLMLFQMTQALFLVTFVIAAFALMVGLGSLILEHGYSGLRHADRFVGPEPRRWVGLSVTGVRIGITIYLAGCVMHHRKILKGVLLPAALATVLVFFLLLGARSEVAVAVLPMIIGYHYFVKRIRLWLGIPLLVAVLILFGVIGIGRRAESLAPQDVYRAYRDYRADTGVNPFVASLAESGASFKTVNVACAFIPNAEPYWYGRSLFDSALMIIPSPIPGLRKPVAPSVWVTLTATGEVGGRQAGWGSSIAMEAYMNFGLLGGTAFMMVVGYMMRRVYDTTLRRPGFLRVCLMLATVTALALWCRNHAHHFIRPVAWTMIVAWLMWSVVGHRMQPQYVAAGRAQSS